MILPFLSGDLVTFSGDGFGKPVSELYVCLCYGNITDYRQRTELGSICMYVCIDACVHTHTMCSVFIALCLLETLSSH